MTQIDSTSCIHTRRYNFIIQIQTRVLLQVNLHAFMHHIVYRSVYFHLFRLCPDFCFIFDFGVQVTSRLLFALNYIA